MDKIFDFFNEWDKLAHTALSAILEAWFTMFFLFAVKHLWIALIASTVLTLLIGFAKETFDADQNGYFNWKDIIADSIGIVAILIPLIVIAICV